MAPARLNRFCTEWANCQCTILSRAPSPRILAIHPSSTFLESPPPSLFDNGRRGNSIHAAIGQQPLRKSIKSRVCCGARAARIHWLRSCHFRAAMLTARMHSRGTLQKSLASSCGSVLACDGRLPLHVHHHGAPQRQPLRPLKKLRQLQHTAAPGLEPCCGTSGVLHAAEEVRPFLRTQLHALLITSPVTPWPVCSEHGVLIVS